MRNTTTNELEETEVAPQLDVELYATVKDSRGNLIGLGQVRYGGVEDYVLFNASSRKLQEAQRYLDTQPGPSVHFPIFRVQIEGDEIIEMSDTRYDPRTVATRWQPATTIN